MKTIVDDIVDKIPDQFNMADIMARIEERTPYIVVAFQVCSWFLSNVKCGIMAYVICAGMRENESSDERNKEIIERVGTRIERRVDDNSRHGGSVQLFVL